MDDDIARARALIAEYTEEGEPFDEHALPEEVLGEMERYDHERYLLLSECGTYAIRRAIQQLAREGREHGTDD